MKTIHVLVLLVSMMHAHFATAAFAARATPYQKGDIVMLHASRHPEFSDFEQDAQIAVQLDADEHDASMMDHKHHWLIMLAGQRWWVTILNNPPKKPLAHRFAANTSYLSSERGMQKVLITHPHDRHAASAAGALVPAGHHQMYDPNLAQAESAMAASAAGLVPHGSPHHAALDYFIPGRTKFITEQMAQWLIHLSLDETEPLIMHNIQLPEPIDIDLQALLKPDPTTFVAAFNTTVPLINFVSADVIKIFINNVECESEQAAKHYTEFLQTKVVPVIARNIQRKFDATVQRLEWEKQHILTQLQEERNSLEYAQEMRDQQLVGSLQLQLGSVATLMGMGIPVMCKYISAGHTEYKKIFYGLYAAGTLFTLTKALNFVDDRRIHKRKSARALQEHDRTVASWRSVSSSPQNSVKLFEENLGALVAQSSREIEEFARREGHRLHAAVQQVLAQPITQPTPIAAAAVDAPDAFASVRRTDVSRAQKIMQAVSGSAKRLLGFWSSPTTAKSQNNWLEQPD